MSEIFMKATQKKLRFDSTQGLLTVEDLWDLPLTGTNKKANLDDIAIGLDSDCHFGDTSITFEIYGTPNVQQSAVPEPGTMLLVGSGLFAAYRRRRRLSA